jgi:2-succinyl-6-hydroxy-2,4-cyclohexadiene-1-carboxylate synthase
VTTEVTTLAATSSTLAASVRGSGRSVTLVHGFAQTGGCLGPLADVLAARCRLVTPDAPGHGGSLRHADAGLEPGAQLLAATGAQGVYVGYSMGGRLCLRAALDRPDAVRALVLIGATAGIEGHEDRAERRRADAALADRLELVGVDTFVQEWLSLPLFAGLPAWARFDRERRTNTAAGLAGSLRHAGTGSMAPLWERLDRLTVPVLCITGSHDERYGELAGRMVDRIGPGARHEVIDGAGHAAHLEHPNAVVEVVIAFLDELPT